MIIKEILKYLKIIFRKELVILWILSLALSVAFITLSLKNKLPLEKGDFAFISILALLIALYRPRWIFFLFISFIPLENIILASGFIPLQLRPYQFLGGMLIIAILILWFSKRLDFKIIKPNWIDTILLSLAPLSLLPLLFSPYKFLNAKNSLILLSFVILYFLIRNFVRNKSDLLKTFAFFVGSYLVVTKYGFYQVLADKFGFKSFEVMFGRPNSTFTEPDWLGIFLCFSLAAFLSLRYYLLNKDPVWNSDLQIFKAEVSKKIIYFIIFLLIFSNIVLIILTLSRSAWIGAVAIIIFYLLLNLYNKTKKGIILNSKIFYREFLIIFIILAISISIIKIGQLSRFDIFDRARSTATYEQKITIACVSENNIPESIAATEDLVKFNCQHINLEDVDSYKARGEVIAQTYRKDPNVMTRSAIYRQSWEILKKHPVIGTGYGTITIALGADERGTGLNESNIFLQVWAGSGILGLCLFIILIGYLFIYAFRRVSPICPLNSVIGCPVVKNDFEKILNVFLVLSLTALIIPNLFNAGLFMGIFWLGLAVIVSLRKMGN